MSLPSGRNISVTLDPWEIVFGSLVGMIRRATAESRGFASGNDFAGFQGNPWQFDVNGAGGEIAAGKVTGRYWQGVSLAQFKGADLFPDIEVRTRSGEGACRDLILKARDDLDRLFVLVHGKMPVYTVVGWIYGRDAERPEWRKSLGGAAPGFFVPEDELLPFPIMRRTS